MKLAVTGKGGVGKTTVSALLSCALVKSGQRVIAIDADPDSNLAACLGHPCPGTLTPLVELKDLIEERTGAKPGTIGGMFKLNPFVEDIPDTYSVELNGVKALVLGAVKRGGSGCYCPENSLIRALITHLLFERETALVLDMEAGIEHLTRGTTTNVDGLVVVVEPGRRSIETALRIRDLSRDLGLTQLTVVGNKIRSDADQAFLESELPADMAPAGFVRFDEDVRAAERDGRCVADAPHAFESALQIVSALQDRIECSPPE